MSKCCTVSKIQWRIARKSQIFPTLCVFGILVSPRCYAEKTSIPRLLSALIAILTQYQHATDRERHWATVYTTLFICVAYASCSCNNNSIVWTMLSEMVKKPRNNKWYALHSNWTAAPPHAQLLMTVTRTQCGHLALRRRMISYDARATQISRSSGGTFSVDSKSMRDPRVSSWLGLYVPRLARFTPTAMATVTQPSSQPRHRHPHTNENETAFPENVLIVKVSFERRKIAKVFMTHVQVYFWKSLSKATFERKLSSESLP